MRSLSPQIIGAVGAALFAADKARKLRSLMGDFP